MTTETNTNHTGPLACKRCGGTDGPLDLNTGVCEICADQDGGAQ